MWRQRVGCFLPEPIIRASFSGEVRLTTRSIALPQPLARSCGLSTRVRTTGIGEFKGVRGILRVDRKFRSHGPQEFKTAYKKRAAVERVFSRLQNLASLTQHNLRGLAKITFHSQLCVMIMLLTAQAAVNTHNGCKARSIRYFAN